MSLRTLAALLLAACVNVIASAQPSTISSPMLRHPLASSVGLVMTNEAGDRLFLQSGDSVRQIVHSAGCGMYHALSPDGSRLGFKSISPAGQAPAVLDLATNAVRLLNSPAPRVGQVSFARDGRCGFTVGDSLIVIDGANRLSFSLGTYANLAPLSPNGDYAVFNNDDDQIFLLSLSDGSSVQITDGRGGYALPQWSPDGKYLLYASLGGDMKVYDLNTRATASVDEGFSVSWSYDSRSIIYYKKTITNGILTNTELYMATPDGRNIRQLTNTPDVCEIDPSFARDDRAILFQTFAKGETYAAAVSEAGTLGASRMIIARDAVQEMDGGAPLMRTAEGVSVTSGLDIPYVHQVWDTPDWFNGHAACAPTTAMMLLAYYNVLPRWDVSCSGPTYHLSPWGRYICEQYSYRQTPFTAAAADPNGTPSFGGYGFMWATGSPHTTMASYYQRHGLWASQAELPPHSAAVAEIEAGFPYSMCVGLTSAGHLILAHGFGAEQHTLLFNDPYGNKNLIAGSGYPNLYGKDVLYDWPGYNNGYQNLQTVFWCIAVHAAVPVQADTLVDDAQIEHGFTLNTQAPASMTRWKDMNQGVGGHFWYCKTTGATDRDTCFAVWRPTLPVAGAYEVSTFIQFSNATAARYRIYGASGCDTVIVNQKAAGGSWLSLGVHQFDAGTAGYVVLGDGAAPAGQEIVFDAMRWTCQSTAAIAAERAGQSPEGYVLLQNYPNPFNPTTSIRYFLPIESRVRVTVYDILGNAVSTVEETTRPAGDHRIDWNAESCATGVYIALFEAHSLDGKAHFRKALRMMLVR